MTSSVQIITSPTADTPGTTLMLQTQKQHYIFGTHAEGTQRAMVEQGLRMTRVQNFFMTGKMDWKNAGGLIGMTLTLADSATSAYDMAMEMHRKSNKAARSEPERPKINVYGPPNLKHALNTCRRYIFRKGVPVVATEYKDVPPQKSEHGSIHPTWQDDAIQVWALCISPTHKEADPHLEQHVAKLQEGYEQYANSFEEHQAPANETAEEREARYDRIRSTVLNLMFNSKWTLDTLVERHISEVEPPAAMFIRNPETHRIEPYRGPKPGGAEPLPDIKVLTRTPWPGAIVTGLPPTTPKTESLSYIVRTQPTRGTFDAKRAKELGLKPGPQFGKLSKGQSVENDKGETITPDMVIGPDKPGNGFALLDIPSADHLEKMLQREEFQSEELTKGIKIFYWALGPGVSGHPILQQFIARFSEAEHFVSSVDDCPNRLALGSVSAQTVRLSAIDPVRYRLPHYDLDSLPQTSLYGLGSPGKAGMLQTVITTLGTGSACPSKYRNVSATLMRVPGVGNYLFDCGESTLGQLQRVFGAEELLEILKDLRMIWISHLHADHHLGTASVIREWYRVKHNSVPRIGHPSKSSVLADDGSLYGLSVVSHQGMIKWLREYSQVEDFGYSRILPFEITPAGRDEYTGSRLTLTSTAVDGQREENRLVLQQKDYENILGLADIQACRVSHCHGAMAVSLTFPRSPADPKDINPLKVSYSGDCRPSHHFTQIGHNSTVLIHEATFDDELKGDALAKKHSTTSEALGIGAKMDAKAVVLTHFSQRYQKIPVLQTVQDGEQDDLPDANAMEDVQPDDADDVPADAAAAAAAPALPSDSARPPPQLRKAESSSAHEQVIKVKSKDMKVAIAFDYMRVKIGEIAQLEKFNDALNRLLTSEEEAEVPGGEGAGEPVINSNGKKTSGDEGGGRKKKSKRNN
ncbi:ribonuclease Z mitochondrial precursor [Bimuria novae-zelandiae CBS 107.79]|uniref:ribonuclease Z n=1 Tax=Bimuria novae-zelandiae CBS 107.79 TaxID=1447943 RepID=A0A6A5VGK5_9PLEO|nr:ribonuclease Z mitochondrial precursor [Bimuria novae-zelandiae CBS 107.79]